MVTPLNTLTYKELGAIKKGYKLRLKELVPIKLTPIVKEAFECLKAIFLTIPILVHYNPDRPTRVETDALGCAILGILSQLVPGKDNHRP